MISAHSSPLATAFRRLLSLGSLKLLAACSVAQEPCGTPSLCGEWGNLTEMTISSEGHQTVHAVLLHTARVLCVDTLNASGADILLFNPVDGSLQLVWNSPELPENSHRLYCSGHAQLRDGRILFASGGFLRSVSNFRTSVYTPDPNGIGTFAAGPDELWDSDGDGTPNPTYRWYPTCTTLGDGSILITDGFEHFAYGADCGASGGFGNANVPVILQPNDGAPNTWTWEPLLSAEYNRCPPNFDFDLGLYPFMFLLSNGKVFMAGSHYANHRAEDNPAGRTTRALSIGLASWDLLPNPAPLNSIKGGSAVMFQANGVTRIMKAGGEVEGGQTECPSGLAERRAFEFRPYATGATWDALPDMPHRRNIYLIALPDGKILAVGGNTGDLDGDSESCEYPDEIVFNPDVFDPFEPDPQLAWKTLAPMATPRMYHSAALLLPDGSVFTAGGQYLFPPVTAAQQRSYQIFKPPYFFAYRPAITACPIGVRYNRGFNVDTGDATVVTKVRLISLGSATHSFDHSQRMLELNFTLVDSNTLRVSAPASGNHAPPGYYMLFVATGPNGSRPSVARILQLGVPVELQGPN